ncbi:MAG: phosphotransferase [Gaiellaceae bacterium]
MTSEPPSSRVLSAFGASGQPLPLHGGQGTSWRSGDLVLKPLDRAQEELAWQAELFDSLACDGFRVARSVRAADSSLVVEGWCAYQALEVRHEKGRWTDIVAAGERFHAALAGTPRPAFLYRRSDPWAIGDRVAWGELPAGEYVHVKHLTRLCAALRPVQARSQLIHGDLTGNVLFAAVLPPAVIDFAPYWRPPMFASAIVVADALVWEGADKALVDAIADEDDFPQYLLRALVYRVVTDRLFRLDEPPRPDAADPYLPAVETACRLAAG